MFSAALRVGDVDAKTREAFVNEVCHSCLGSRVDLNP